MQVKFIVPLVVLLFAFFIGRGQTTATVSSLKFLGQYVVPHNYQYNGTTVGGLSGID